MDFSYSSITKYLTCPQAFALRYVNGVRVRGERATNRQLGLAVHAGLAGCMLDYAHGRPASLAQHIAEWGKENEPDFSLMDDYGNLFCDASEWDAMLKRAVAVGQRFLDHLNFAENYEVLWHNNEPMAEMPMRVEVGADAFVGTPDAVVRDRHTGAVEIWDFKVGEKQMGFDYYVNSQQLPMYVILVGAFTGIEANSAVIWQIKNQTPQTPARNKSDEPGKRMSRAAITTDWPTYKQAVIDNGDDPALYEDMRVKLLGKANEWFERLSYSYKPETLTFFWDNALNAMREIKGALGPGRAFPRVFNPYNCQRCEFRALCGTLATGDDATALFSSEGRYFLKEEVDAGSV